MEHANSSTDSQDTGNQMNELDEIIIQNVNQLIIGLLNINFLRNKFEILEEVFKDKIETLVSEKKLDSSLTVWQFLVKGYNTPFKLDGNQTVVGLLLDVSHDLTCKLLSEFTSEKAAENIFVKIEIEQMAPFIILSLHPKHKFNN